MKKNSRSLEFVVGLVFASFATRVAPRLVPIVILAFAAPVIIGCGGTPGDACEYSATVVVAPFVYHEDRRAGIYNEEGDCVPSLGDVSAGSHPGTGNGYTPGGNTGGGANGTNQISFSSTGFSNGLALQKGSEAFVDLLDKGYLTAQSQSGPTTGTLDIDPNWMLVLTVGATGTPEPNWDFELTVKQGDPKFRVYVSDSTTGDEGWDQGVQFFEGDTGLCSLWNDQAACDRLEGYSDRPAFVSQGENTPYKQRFAGHAIFLIEPLGN